MRDVMQWDGGGQVLHERMQSFRKTARWKLINFSFIISKLELKFDLMINIFLQVKIQPLGIHDEWFHGFHSRYMRRYAVRRRRPGPMRTNDFRRLLADNLNGSNLRDEISIFRSSFLTLF